MEELIIDCKRVIIDQVDNIHDLARLKRTCKEWNKLISDIAKSRKNDDHLCILLNLYPNSNWNFYFLSNNIKLKWSTIKKHINKRWNIDHIMDNIKVPEEDLINMLKQKYDMLVNAYDSITPGTLQFAGSHLPENKYLTWEIVQKCGYKDGIWTSYHLARILDITDDTIREFVSNNHKQKYMCSIDINLYSEDKYEMCLYHDFSFNSYLTIEFILSNLDKPWDWDVLSSSKVIHPNDIAKYELEKYINYEQLSINPNLKWKYVKENLDKPWNLKWLSNNPYIDLTLDDILSNHTISWSWYELSGNPCISLQSILDKWNQISNKINVASLSYRKDVTWNIVNKYNYINWDIQGLISNKHTINLEIIKTNPHIDWGSYWDDINEHVQFKWDDIVNNLGQEWFKFDFGKFSRQCNY